MSSSIAIIGASTHRSKYGNKAVRAYRRQGWTVFPVNPNAPVIEGLQAYRSLRDVPAEHLDRVSLYVPPSVGLQLLDDIAARPGAEVWLNPGAGAPELVRRGKELGLNIILGCSIVAVGVSPDEFDD
ncbi:CoA-binding protein [Planctomycetaceae bacterium SCGC AG-212-F19]|nr:CoA-binding protein [Planctomycetaceae bacterium SCGC AG-212-F19]